MGFGAAAGAGATAAAAGSAAAASTAAATAAAAGSAAAAGTAAATGLSFSTIATIASLATTAVGGIISAFGQAGAGQSNAAASMYQAQVARNNQTIAQQNAELVTQAGAAASEQEGMKTRSTVGAIKAAQAASNIDVNSGSAVDVRSSASELGELNQLTVRSNAARQAYGYESIGANYGAQAQIDTMQAQSAVRAGTIGEFSTLLGTASSVGSKYAQWQQSAGGGPAIF